MRSNVYAWQAAFRQHANWHSCSERTSCGGAASTPSTLAFGTARYVDGRQKADIVAVALVLAVDAALREGVGDRLGARLDDGVAVGTRVVVKDGDPIGCVQAMVAWPKVDFPAPAT